MQFKAVNIVCNSYDFYCPHSVVQRTPSSTAFLPAPHSNCLQIKAVHFSSLSMVLIVVLFHGQPLPRWKYPHHSSSLRVIVRNWCWILVKCFFHVNRYHHVVFLLDLLWIVGKYVSAKRWSRLWGQGLRHACIFRPCPGCPFPRALPDSQLKCSLRTGLELPMSSVISSYSFFEGMCVSFEPLAGRQFLKLM